MHKEFLIAALEAARQYRGQTAPNPAVGAVAVRDGEIIARAAHKGAGSAHAEQELLAMLPPGLQRVILYVTLEPCNHWGRTPPCTDAIIAYGITEVIYGFRDINPLVVGGNTTALLNAHGIRTRHFPLPAIDEFYQSYAFWLKTGLPYVTVKLAQTLDGKIAGNHGARVALTNDACNKLTATGRFCADVILTTAKTINQDNPRLTVRSSAGEIGRNLAVIDARLEVDPEIKAYKLAKSVHIFHLAGYLPPTKRENYHIIAADAAGRLDLFLLMQELGRRGFHDVWVEAGGILCNALHEARLVNHTLIYIVPKILSESNTLAWPGADIFKVEAYDTINWQSVEDNMILSVKWRREVKDL